jgi:signal transduction histidine kinase
MYQLRVRQIAARMALRFDERLAERTRLARDLHDTLLQTIQASKIVADVALEDDESLLGDPKSMRSTLEKLSQWLEKATVEGRAALNSLRITSIAGDDLAEALRQAATDCLITSSMKIAFSADGTVRKLAATASHRSRFEAAITRTFREIG